MKKVFINKSLSLLLKSKDYIPSYYWYHLIARYILLSHRRKFFLIVVYRRFVRWVMKIILFYEVKFYVLHKHS